MQRFKIVLPITIIVFIFAIIILEKNYENDISIQIRTLISLGGALFSGLITYFLFPDISKAK